MKIEFSNTKLTVAIITRTRWRWRSLAFFVEYAGVEYNARDGVWCYAENGLAVEGAYTGPLLGDHGLQAKIIRAVDRERALQREDALIKHALDHPDPPNPWKIWKPSMGRVPGARL